MAESPSHKFGQIIGDLVEEAVVPILSDFARRHGIYLDRKGPRPARTGRKVSWVDEYGNKHDLDFVLERNGSAGAIGVPIAFIETAWRRYTKHSRNKAQEIQGAVLPLLAKHHFAAPFLGVIAAGVYTDTALRQLRSVGFTVLHFPYETVCKAFAAGGIDARFDEKTSDAACVRKVKAWARVSKSKRARIAAALIEMNRSEVERFMAVLELTATRRIDKVTVTPLYGTPLNARSIEEALALLASDPRTASKRLLKYEISIRYSNSDTIEASFAGKEEAAGFLEQFRTARFTATP